MEAATMETVTLTVASRVDVKRRLANAFKGKKQGAQISFATPGLLFRVLTPKRWDLICVLTGAGPLTITETARRLGRDAKVVERDVRALLNVGILRKDGRRIVFPFDAVRLDAVLSRNSVDAVRVA
jgi:predicted transcriptional regulator